MTKGSLGRSGYSKYYRIKTREDRDKGAGYNLKTYNYIGEHTGYPTYNNADNLPETFSYQVSVSKAANTTTTYTFNNKHLLVKEEVKDSSGKVLCEVNNLYDSNKLLIKKTTKTFEQVNTGSKCKTASIENTYDSNNFWDLVKQKDELGHVTTYVYEQGFHKPIKIEKQSDGIDNQITEFAVNPYNGNYIG